MSISHIVLIASTPEGYLPSCSCGWRNTKFVNYTDALTLSDKHEWDAKNNRLNRGPRPLAATSARLFRENSTNAVFTAEEREMWGQLADELEHEIKAQSNAPLEGQIELF